MGRKFPVNRILNMRRRTFQFVRSVRTSHAATMRRAAVHILFMTALEWSRCGGDLDRFFRANRHEEGIFERECAIRGVRQSSGFFHAIIEWRTLFQVFVFRSLQDLTECADSAEVAEVMDS